MQGPYQVYPVYTGVPVENQFLQNTMQVQPAVTYSNAQRAVYSEEVPQIIRSKVVRQIPIVAQQRIIRVPPASGCRPARPFRSAQSRPKKILRIRRKVRRHQTSESESEEQADYASQLQNLLLLLKNNSPKEEEHDLQAENLHLQILQLKRQLGDKDNALQLMRGQLRQKQQSLLDNRKKLMTMKVNEFQDQKDNKIEELEAIIESLQHQSKYNPPTAEIDALKQKLAALESAFRQKNRRPSKADDFERADLEAELRELQAQNENLKQEKDKLKNDLADRQKKGSLVKNDVEKNYQDEVNRARGKQKKLEGELAAKGKQNAALEKQIGGLNDQIHSITLNLNFKDKELQLLRKQLQAMRQKQGDLERANNQLEIAHKKAKNKARELESVVNSMPPSGQIQRLKEVNRMTNSFHQLPSDSEYELKRLRGLLQDLDKEKQNLQRLLKEKNQNELKLNMKLMELQGDLAVNGRILQLEKQDKNKLEKQLEKALSQLANLKISISLLRETGERQGPELERQRLNDQMQKKEIARLQEQAAKKDRALKQMAMQRKKPDENRWKQKENDLEDQLKELARLNGELKKANGELQRRNQDQLQKIQTLKKQNIEMSAELKEKSVSQPKRQYSESREFQPKLRELATLNDQVDSLKKEGEKAQKENDKLRNALEEMKFKLSLAQREKADSEAKERERAKEMAQMADNLNALAKDAQQAKNDKMKAMMEMAVKEEKMKGLADDLAQKSKQISKIKAEEPKPKPKPVEPEECRLCKQAQKKKEVPKKKKDKGRKELKDAYEKELKLLDENRDLADRLNQLEQEKKEQQQQPPQPVIVESCCAPPCIIPEHYHLEQLLEQMRDRVRQLEDARESLMGQLNAAVSQSVAVQQRPVERAPEPTRIVRPQIHQIIQEVVPSMHEQVIFTEEGYDAKNPCNNYVVKANPYMYSQQTQPGCQTCPQQNPMFQSYIRPMQQYNDVSHSMVRPMQQYNDVSHSMVRPMGHLQQSFGTDRFAQPRVVQSYMGPSQYSYAGESNGLGGYYGSPLHRESQAHYRPY